MKEYLLERIDNLREDREREKALLGYEEHLKQGFRIKHKYNPEAGNLEFWEVDAWDREGRRWVVTDIPQTKTARKAVSLFMHEISDDWYNIRDTYAKQKRWTYEQVEGFQEWLEAERWPHP